MNIRMIDVSGSMFYAGIEKIPAHIQVGDRVIQFDTEVLFDAVMKSQAEIDQMVFLGRGGTLIEPALKAAESDPKANIYCYSDGCFDDTYLRDSAAYRENRFKLIDPQTL